MVTLRVGTWNLNARGAKTWNRLLRLRDHVDVLLVQESAVPAEFGRAHPNVAVWPPADDVELRTPNGGAPTRIILLSDRFEMLGRELVGANGMPPRAHRGTLAVADVLWRGRLIASVASGYGMFEEGDVSHRSVERVLHDVQMTFGAVPRKLILGGDFNMWIQPWNGAPWPDYAITFRHIADDLRMADCL